MVHRSRCEHEARARAGEDKCEGGEGRAEGHRRRCRRWKVGRAYVRALRPKAKTASGDEGGACNQERDSRLGKQGQRQEQGW